VFVGADGYDRGAVHRCTVGSDSLPGEDASSGRLGAGGLSQP
jgi:hypothetical protein